MKWLERIREARKRGKFTLKDYRDSANWEKCAISENPKIRHIDDIPREEPRSKIAKRLGFKFFDAVTEDDFTSAEKLLRRIKNL